MKPINVTILPDCSYVCYNVLIIITRFKDLTSFIEEFKILVSNFSKDAGRLGQNNGYEVVLD